MDPLNSKEFWDAARAARESFRVFDVCHGCRRCFNLCPSFGALFTLIDNADGAIEKLGDSDVKEVVDLCYYCKLCYDHCPYTPPHRFDIDFPRLMLRNKAIMVSKRGIPWVNRVMLNTDLIGKVGCALSPLSNWATKNRLNRILMELFLGIHKDRLLPEFGKKRFSTRHNKLRNNTNEKMAVNGKAALFYTCLVDYNFPDIGSASVDVLQRNGVEVFIPEQVCCGMPFFSEGDLESARIKAEANIRSLKKAIDAGYDIVVLGPTCSNMLKLEYPFLVDSEDSRVVASRSYDITEYLIRLNREGRLIKDFKWSPGRVAYQIPCHMRVQHIGAKSMELLKLIPDTEVALIERCSGHDGSWGMKKEYFELSLKVGRNLFREIEELKPDMVSTDCPLSGLQIEQATGLKPLHPVEIFSRAYGNGAA